MTQLCMLRINTVAIKKAKHAKAQYTYTCFKLLFHEVEEDRPLHIDIRENRAEKCPVPYNTAGIAIRINSYPLWLAI